MIDPQSGQEVVRSGSGIVHLITDHWEYLITLGGAAAGAVALVWWTLKKTIPSLLEEIHTIKGFQEKLEGRVMDLGFAKKRDFFDEKGLPLYQLRSGCLEMRGDCTYERKELQKSLCEKMEEMKKQVSESINEIHSAVNVQSEEANSQSDQIKDILNRVERIFEKDRQTERREEMHDLAEALGERIADAIVKRVKKDSKGAGFSS